MFSLLLGCDEIMSGNVFTSIKNISPILSVNTQKDISMLKLMPGQKIIALVISNEGDTYLLQKGESVFTAKASTPLELGQWVKLEVLDSETQTLLLKKISDEVNSKNTADKKSLLIKKYGDFSSNELAKIEEMISKLNIDDNKTIKALLDPHILSTLFLPNSLNNDYKKRIEINHYKNIDKKQSIFEICFELDFELIGHVEVIIKWIDGALYARIWPESSETERLLQSRCEELQEHFTWVEVLKFKQGPIIAREMTEKIDVKV